MIDQIAITYSVSSHSYLIEIKIGALDLLRLQTKSILGLSFKKNKYEFLSDLRDIISEEIIRLFEELYDKEQGK